MSDNAGPLAEEEAARLFEPFFAARGVAQPAALGLAVAYGILHEAEASLEARTTGTGLDIIVTLRGG